MRNMKKIIIFFTSLATFFNAFNQEIEFKEINNWIKNNPGELRIKKLLIASTFKLT